MANEIRARGRIPFNFVDGLKVKGVDVITITDITPTEETVGATALVGSNPNAARADHRHAMPGLVTPGAHGFMSAADKSKIDAIQDGAAAVTSSLPTNEGVGSAAMVGTAITAARADHVHAMPGLATTSVDGFMSASDKAKLDGVQSGAQVNTVTSVAGRTGTITLSVTDVTGAAPTASPTFTGTPTVPTAAPGTNTTQAASTAFVGAAVAAAGGTTLGSTAGAALAAAGAAGVATTAARADHVHPFPSLANLGAASAAANVFTGVQTFLGTKETRVALTASAIDLALGTYFSKTSTAATTLTVTNVAAAGTCSSFILDLSNGGAYTLSFGTGFTSVKWAGGTQPTLTASGRDVLGFFTHDGGATWTGIVLSKDVK